MARLTITLSDERHLQLKLQAARSGKTIGALIEESLVSRDEENRRRALELTAKARANAAKAMPEMSDEEIEAFVLEEIAADRRERRGQRGS